MNHLVVRWSGRFLLATAMLFPACASVEIVAHRGASFDAPENTLAAFELAWQQDADAIEGDFHLSKDGQVVTLHDASLRRTTGVDRQVSQLTLDELRSLDVGAWKDPQWAGQRIPTLEEVLATIPRGKNLRLEVKCGPEIVPVIRQVLRASKVRPRQVTIISFNQEVIAASKEQLNRVEAHWLFAFKKDEQTDQWNSTAEQLVQTALRIGADGVGLAANERVDEALAETIRRAGLELHVWTINDSQLARRMIDLGAQSITTDRPGYLRSALMARP